ncbi:hypothetical protein CC2G_001907 [Coprinopsis cinerea AmutBmut pab1-1]|nr:hypothetical protein CC2G_001907 [Coprinopsis cinerea AmutBmut pab1-1]
MRVFSIVVAALAVASPVLGAPQGGPILPAFKTIPSNDRNIFYHGRWDENNGSWWAGTGFKVNIQNLRRLSINLGTNSSWPSAPTAISFDNGKFETVELASGTNHIAIPEHIAKAERGKTTLLRVNVQGWQQNRIQFQSLDLNIDARLEPYKPAKRAFQFIGDSLSAGQFLPQGVNQAWPFLVGEHFKAEHRINAQPGATLTDRESYGNVHGISYQYFRTEDTGFIWTSDHNYTTPWDFKRDVPRATHIIIHVGANDASHDISGEDFTKVYQEFLDKLRKINGPRAHIFIFTPWGWPNADGNTYYYYEGVYEAIVKSRRAKGDRNIHLVDTTGWVTWDDVFHDNVHPNVPGMANIADKFIEWLEKWEARNRW